MIFNFNSYSKTGWGKALKRMKLDDSRSDWWASILWIDILYIELIYKLKTIYIIIFEKCKNHFVTLAKHLFYVVKSLQSPDHISFERYISDKTFTRYEIVTKHLFVIERKCWIRFVVCVRDRSRAEVCDRDLIWFELIWSFVDIYNPPNVPHEQFKFPSWNSKKIYFEKVTNTFKPIRPLMEFSQVTHNFKFWIWNKKARNLFAKKK